MAGQQALLHLNLYNLENILRNIFRMFASCRSVNRILMVTILVISGTFLPFRMNETNTYEKTIIVITILDVMSRGFLFFLFFFYFF